MRPRGGRRPMLTRGMTLASLACLLLGGIANAAVDMSGAWAVEVTLPGPTLLYFSSTVTQAGTDLTIVTTCPGPNCTTGTSVGTIDPDTGVFSVEDQAAPPGSLVTNGTVAGDSRTFTAVILNEGQYFASSFG